MESGETSWALWSECPRALAKVGIRNDPSSMDTRGGERSALHCEPRGTLGANRESHWAHLQCGGFEAFAPRSRYPEEERDFFSSRRRHTRLQGDWSSDVCSSD